MNVIITGIAKVNGDQVSCRGSIEIINKSERVVYATWKLLDNSNNFLGSVSRNYFIGDKQYSDPEILNKIIEDILSYRVGRLRIFSNIRIG